MHADTEAKVISIFETLDSSEIKAHGVGSWCIFPWMGRYDRLAKDFKRSLESILAWAQPLFPHTQGWTRDRF
ncbi:MAG: hypothetical protein OXD42_03075 [Rhodospirillaceae bacterium]|nr:hypothetical protein [Rhodospirillaceae bacterium]